jgi:Zn-dependent M28 family amino/carboxypeptidase
MAVIVDMIGDSSLDIYIERNSLDRSENLTRLLWSLAGELVLPGFRASPRYRVLDDHIPFIQRGIPATLLIDFDYPYWHTTEDTVDKCSAESLGQVGKLLTHFIYRTLPEL